MNAPGSIGVGPISAGGRFLLPELLFAVLWLCFPPASFAVTNTVYDNQIWSVNNGRVNDPNFPIYLMHGDSFTLGTDSQINQVSWLGAYKSGEVSENEETFVIHLFAFEGDEPRPSPLASFQIEAAERRVTEQTLTGGMPVYYYTTRIPLTSLPAGRYLIAVMNHSGPWNQWLWASNDSGVGEVFNQNAEEGYWARYSGIGVPEFAFALSEASEPEGEGPRIVRYPISQAVTAGTNVTFKAVALGSAPLVYQWQFNSNAISGETNYTLNLTNVQVSHSGFYRVRVSNPLGVSNTVNASLTVTPSLPNIVVHPRSSKLLPGEPLELGVTATGEMPLQFQWRLNGMPILDATNTTFSIPAVELTDSGAYSVIVSNAWGMRLSSNAVISISTITAWGAGSSNLNITPTAGQSVVPFGVTNAVAIAAGAFHSLALMHNGRVVSWGYRSTTNVPTSLNGVRSISAGENHSLALRTNGTLAAWGQNNWGVLNIPPSASNVMAISSGGVHNLALRSNGTVVAWGAGTYLSSWPSSGQSMVPTNLNGVAAIAAGGYHSLALRSNGTMVAWGLNASGQTNVPPGLSNVVAITAGASNSAALLLDRTLVIWGANAHGQTNPPASITNAVAISAGGGHILALSADGAVSAWGLSNHGQTNVPVNVTNITAIAAGGYHNLTLMNAGPVAFLNAPYSQTVFKGGLAFFNPAVLGQGPISFQWQRNGTDIPDATNAVLQFSNVQLDDAGMLQLIASNIFGAVTSAPAILTILDTAPSFSLQPQSGAVLQSSNVTLSAALTGLPPISLRWDFNGTPIPDATNLSLTLTNAQLTNEGFYTLLASNDHGVSVSSNAFVDVIDLPQALGLTNVSWHSLYSPTWFAQSANTHDGIAAGASGPLRYQNQNTLRTSVTGPGRLTFWCNGGPGMAMNFSIDAMSPVSRSFSGGSAWQKLTFDLSANVHILTWTAINQSSSFYSNMVFLDDMSFTPGFIPATIIGNPVSRTQYAGKSESFVVNASGTPPIKYQWYLNGAEILGATSTTLQVVNVQTNHAGNYHVVVTGPSNTVSSSPVSLTVLPSAPVFTLQPASLKVLLGSAVAFSAKVSGSEPFAYQWSRDDSPIPGAHSPTLTIDNVQALHAGRYNLVVSNSAGAVVTSNAWLEVYSHDDLRTALDNPALTWSTTNFAWFPQTNVTHDGISAAQSGVISNSQSSSIETMVTGPAMVVYWWKVNCDGFWNELAFSANDIQQSSIKGNVDWQRTTNYVGSGTQRLQWKLYPIHGSFAGGTGWLDQVEVTPIPGTGPSVISQPGNQAVDAGNNVTFAATATGTTPLRYQWQFNGNDVPGWTNSTLTLNDVQKVNAGTYGISVTNDFGFASGTNFTLSVNNTLAWITGQPASQTNVMNGRASFSVWARGAAPLRYQWYFNNAPIVGAVSNIFVIPRLQATNAGNYHVVVSNMKGYVSSAPAVLTLVSSRVLDFYPPALGATPASGDLGDVIAIAAGYDFTLALRSDGIVKAWGFNSFGATEVPPGLSNVVSIAAGSYHCLVLKADGTLVSWGSLGYGEGSVPQGLSNVVAIASGPDYNLALKMDGTVAGWGNNASGQTDVPADLKDVQAIFAGHSNGFALRSDGSLVQWGSGPVWKHNGLDTQLVIPGTNIVAVTATGLNGWSLQEDGVARAHGFFDGSAPYTNTYAGLTATSTATRGPNIYFGIKAIAASGTGNATRDYVMLLDDDGFVTLVPAAGAFTDSSRPFISSNPGNGVAISARNIHAAVLMNDGTPIVNRPSFDRAVFTGDTTVFYVDASGSLQLNYQWQWNGTNIVSATNAILVLTNIPLSAAGNYTCIVSNSAGVKISRPAVLSVQRSTPWFDAHEAGYATESGFRLKLDQVSGHGSVVIYASTNLFDWVPILTNPPHLGAHEFIDLDATNLPARFYRAEEQ